MFNPEKDLINLDEHGKKREKETDQESIRPDDETEKKKEVSKDNDRKTLEEERAEQSRIDQENLKKIREKLENPEKKKEIIEEYGEKRASTLKNVMDLGVKTVPVVGEASMIFDGATGKNLVTGEKLTGKERVFNVAVGTGCLVLDFIPIAGEAGEAARIAMVLGKGARIGKAAEKGIVAGRSIKGIEGLSKLAAKSKKGEKFSNICNKTAAFMKKNPKLVEKSEKFADSKIKEYLTKNNPAQKRLEELKKDPGIGSLLEKTGITDDAKPFSIKDFTKEKALSFFKRESKPEITPEESKEDLEKRKVA